MRKLLDTLGLLVNGLSIALFFYLATTLDVPDVPLTVRFLGWSLLILGFILIVISAVTLITNREHGLIDWGIFGVIRHPMYLGAILLFFSWIFFLPHWIILVVSTVNAAIVYWFILLGERHNIARFGDKYRSYMETVPRMNLLAGLLRNLQNR